MMKKIYFTRDFGEKKKRSWLVVDVGSGVGERSGVGDFTKVKTATMEHYFIDQ